VETFGVRSLKIKIFPASNVLNCEGWVKIVGYSFPLLSMGRSGPPPAKVRHGDFTSMWIGHCLCER
jgi:hypothetical protein